MSIRSEKGNRMKSVDVVVIDSGVDTQHRELMSKRIDGISISMDGIHNDYSDQIGHGTAICGIILRHVPEAQIFMIKIFDNLNASIENTLLVAALNYVYENINCRVINMSIGVNTLENHSELYELCNKLRNKNTLLISAFDNCQAVSYPAVYDNVIGVDSCSLCKTINEVYIYSKSCVNVGAFGKMQRIIGPNNTYTVAQGSSYACAHVSAMLLTSQNLYNNINQQLSHLHSWDYCLDYLKNQVIQLPQKQYKKVVVYPFNKEIHSLVRYNSMLGFELIDVYDTKYSAQVGAYTDKIIGETGGKNYKIKNIENIEWDSFDTIIIGHTKRLEEETCYHIPSAKTIIKDALSKNKNVFSFDDYNDDINMCQKDLYYSPRIMSQSDNETAGKLYKVGTPVLGIFGTSSKQGKFSLQLIIRKKLLERGYSIAQMGTEPSAYLFKMDACYHFGYGVKTDFGTFETVSYLNKTMHYLDLLEKDIIVVGCQSNTSAPAINHINDIPIAQTMFLYGTMPDGIVLCINLYDDIEYIIRTVNSMESQIDCKVIALILFPLTYINQNYGVFGRKRQITFSEYENLRDEIKTLIGIPVYILANEEHMNALIDNIIEHFS